MRAGSANHEGDATDDDNEHVGQQALMPLVLANAIFESAGAALPAADGRRHDARVAPA
jgi:hypothetical protein